MPKLLLQKPSKSSKAKEQLKALERHMKLWDDGSIEELSYESQTIRDRLRSDKECMVIAKNFTHIEESYEKRKCSWSSKIICR